MHIFGTSDGAFYDINTINGVFLLNKPSIDPLALALRFVWKA